MDATMFRIVCGVLCVVLLALIVLRRKGREVE